MAPGNHPDTPHPDTQVFADRYRVFASDVIAPAVFPRSWPLSVAAWQTPDPVAPSDAAGEVHTPVDLGWHWGPRWSTCWFHVTGEVPAQADASNLVVRFHAGTEATVWVGLPHRPIPTRGLDVNRDEVPLAEALGTDNTIDLRIEAACNHPFGIVTFDWDHAEDARRWNSDTPGRLDRAELVEVDESVRSLLHAYRFAHQLLLELDPHTQRAADMHGALRDATNTINDHNVHASVEPAMAHLKRALSCAAPGEAPICHAVAHAHIDTAWLWPIRETRRKVIRSWTNTLRLMEQNPDLHFICSQPQQYAWLEDDAPEVFDQIRNRATEGRWEPIGAMWIEPDVNVPSGESLCRQIIHGTRYWQDQFGDRGVQHTVYLPDTFGFPATLPTIMHAAGLDTFITNKLGWSQFNTMPHNDFVWRGLDGSEVVTHFTPGGDYNATLTPKELRKIEHNLHGRDQIGHAPAHALQPFGFGDGGGGPTQEMLDRAVFASDCSGLPKTTLSSYADFREQLHNLAHDAELPVWDGELYLELHRGTLTTQAWLKAVNRRAEQALRLAEILVFAGPSDPSDDSAQEDLDRVWKLLLLNQFHDILPGSSIGWVYDDARAQHAEIAETTERITRDALARWTTPDDGAHSVVNPASTDRFDVVNVDDELRLVGPVPALGIAPADPIEHPSSCVTTTERSLDNQLVRLELDDAGRIVRLEEAPTGIALASREHPIGELVMLEDRPMAWDAWDIDLYAESKPIWRGDQPAQIRVLTDHPLRGEIEVVRAVGDSTITQVYRLDSCAYRVDVETRVDWRETHRLLRVEFATDVRTDFATYDVSFGHVRRPTHRNTSWDRARFEVPLHRWMDLSETGRGLAVLNDSKYGGGCLGSVMHLTLLRSPTHPDPEADKGEHVFTYALMPHFGDWRRQGVAREAEALNAPLRVVPGRCEEAWSPIDFGTDVGECVAEVVALKPAEDGSGDLVLRLVEIHGGRGEVRVRWNLDIERAWAVDLLEEPTEMFHVEQNDRIVRVPMTPFSIRTIRVSRRG